jgi:hypothetical protein
MHANQAVHLNPDTRGKLPTLLHTTHTQASPIPINVCQTRSERGVSQTFGREMERRYKGDLLWLVPVPEKKI